MALGNHGYDVEVKRSITVGRKAEDLYPNWRSPKGLANFMAGCETAYEIDDRRSRWRVKMPGMGLETWESEITEDEPNELIGWRTLGETRFPHEGTVTFAPAPKDLGTVVTLKISTRMPGGMVANAVSRVLGQSPEDYVFTTLRNFKQYMETGEVATNAGPMGRARVFTGLGPKMALAGGAVLAFTGALIYSRRSARGEA